LTSEIKTLKEKFYYLKLTCLFCLFSVSFKQIVNDLKTKIIPFCFIKWICVLVALHAALYFCLCIVHGRLVATSFEIEQFEIFKSLKLKKFTLFDIFNGFLVICIQFYKLSIILIEHPYFVQEVSFKKFILQFKILKHVHPISNAYIYTCICST